MIQNNAVISGTFKKRLGFGCSCKDSVVALMVWILDKGGAVSIPNVMKGNGGTNGRCKRNERVAIVDVDAVARFQARYRFL